MSKVASNSGEPSRGPTAGLNERQIAESDVSGLGDGRDPVAAAMASVTVLIRTLTTTLTTPSAEATWGLSSPVLAPRSGLHTGSSQTITTLASTKRTQSSTSTSVTTSAALPTSSAASGGDGEENTALSSSAVAGIIVGTVLASFAVACLILAAMNKTCRRGRKDQNRRSEGPQSSSSPSREIELEQPPSIPPPPEWVREQQARRNPAWMSGMSDEQTKTWASYIVPRQLRRG